MYCKFNLTMAPKDSAKKKAPSFRLEIPGDQQVRDGIKDKMKLVCDRLQQSHTLQVTNGDIVNTVLDYWLDNHDQPPNTNVPLVSQHQEATIGQTDEDLCVTAKSSITKLLALAEDHGRYCSCRLQVNKVHYIGHVMLYKLHCRRLSAKHVLWWATSPKLPGGKYLVNERVQHGLLFSGMRPSHYERFVQGAGMGKVDFRDRKAFLQRHIPAIDEEYEDSLETALNEEVACYNIDQSDNEWQGIDIKTDARHGHRRNAKDTSVVAIGDQTSKVLSHIHITKQEDPVTQKHEKAGTDKLYQYLDQKNVPVRTHIHDRNTSVNKLIREKQWPTNQNDCWHAIKNLKKRLTNVSHGALCRHGKTWHRQLMDKVEPIGTHAYWALKNSDGDSQKVKESLLNVVEHYQNNHTKCHSSSRCRQKEYPYIPSRIVIDDPKAISLLTREIISSTLYKHPEDFVLCKETAHVESFNNTMNMFQDKRIYYSDTEYLTRSKVSVLHWNENAGRPHTSTWKADRSAHTRRGKVKKNYKRPTYKYRQNIWRKYMNTIY